MSAQVRLDALMVALRSPDYWVVNTQDPEGNCTLLLLDNETDDGGYKAGDIRASFKGTQDECLDQLIAYQVAERLK